MNNESISFPQMVERACGLDVHKSTVVATVNGEGLRKETREFSTFTGSLIDLRTWLQSHGITHVAMESTGIYWKPVLNILEEGGFTILVVNARHVKYVPGHKTDKKDSAWICKLLLAGLLKGSFVPPVDIRELRDLTRYHRKLTQLIAADKNRMIKILEDGNIKLSMVLTDVHGVSGSNILDAILGGERDPEKLIMLCKGRIKAPREDILRSLEGRLTAHHLFMLKTLKQSIEQTRTLKLGVESRIEELLKSYAEEVALLDEIPGVGVQSAGEIISEIGADMSVFPDEKHIASWAGVCPGNNESAGKKKSGRTTKGNKHLRAVLSECSWAASSTKGTFLAGKYKRMVVRRGKKRTIVALGHNILVICYHMLKNKTHFKELGENFMDEKKLKYKIRYHQNILKELGVEIPEKASA
jgi:transposase